MNALSLLKTVQAAAEPATTTLAGKVLVERDQKIQLVVLPNQDGLYEWDASDAGLILNRPEHGLEPVQAGIPGHTVFKTKHDIVGLDGELVLEAPMVLVQLPGDPPKTARVRTGEEAAVEGAAVLGAGILVRCTEEPEYGISMFLRVFDRNARVGDHKCRFRRYSHDHAFVYLPIKPQAPGTTLKPDASGRRIAPAQAQAREAAETTIKFIRGIRTHHAVRAYKVLD